MKNIIYVSSAIKLLDDAQLVEILTLARKNNSERNVSGILLYSEGTFIQVLEGNDADVDYIFGKIEKDTNHKNIITLVDKPISKKNFADWSMGFLTMQPQKLKDILGYMPSVNDLNAKPDTSAAFIILKSFIESNKLAIKY
jgi:hypothetical protein